jgi:hypothetical protein
MCKDPIVKETRKAGEELAKKANYNIHAFFENLRKKEKGENRRIISHSIDHHLSSMNKAI